jgi:hypothetical protein
VDPPKRPDKTALASNRPGSREAWIGAAPAAVAEQVARKPEHAQVKGNSVAGKPAVAAERAARRSAPRTAGAREQQVVARTVSAIVAFHPVQVVAGRGEPATMPLVGVLAAGAQHEPVARAVPPARAVAAGGEGRP